MTKVKKMRARKQHDQAINRGRTCKPGRTALKPRTQRGVGKRNLATFCHHSYEQKTSSPVRNDAKKWENSEGGKDPVHDQPYGLVQTSMRPIKKKGINTPVKWNATGRNIKHKFRTHSTSGRGNREKRGDRGILVKKEAQQTHPPRGKQWNNRRGLARSLHTLRPGKRSSHVSELESKTLTIIAVQ